MAQQQEFADFEVEVDLNGVDAWGGEGGPLAPAGDWQLTLVHLEQKASSKNNSMIVATFEIADEGEYKGIKVWNNYSLLPQSLGRLKQLSVACGAQLDKFRASEHLGQTIRATIVHVEGAGSIGPDGNPRPARMFANVINEAPLEVVEEVKTPTKTPPALKGAANKPPVTTNKPTANGAARRA